MVEKLRDIFHDNNHQEFNTLTGSIEKYVEQYLDLYKQI